LLNGRRNFLSAIGALIFAALFATGALAVVAQDAATPISDEGRPAHIHTGSCPEPGDIVAPLNNLTSPSGPTSDVGTPTDAAASMRGIPAEYSWTNIPMSLDDIMAGEHAINVHESDTAMDVYLACGDVGGTVDADGTLVIGLAEVDDSGFAGIAVLSPNPDDPATTDVSVFIAQGLTSDSGA
jgi:hypothetical protein